MTKPCSATSSKTPARSSSQHAGGSVVRGAGLLVEFVVLVDHLDRDAVSRELEAEQEAGRPGAYD